MYQKERLERILEIVNARGFTTIKELMSELFYSNATIHRDVVALENAKKIKRINGGIEPIKEIRVPLPFRYDKMKDAKIRISKKAVSLINDGETVFIDGSSTTQYMSHYLLVKKEIHVITNNISLASFLADNNVKVTVLGGEIVDSPYITSGLGEIDALVNIKIDKMFFSCNGFDDNGNIYAETFFYLYKCARRLSQKTYQLADSSKHDSNDEKKIAMRFSDVDFLISDYDFPEKIKSEFYNTQFIKV